MQFFQRKYTIGIGIIMVMVWGALAWISIPLELSPDASLPSITISMSWGRTSPEIMEQEVTRRIEQAVFAVRNVKNVTSTSSEGRSSVSVEFEKSTPIDFRLVELRDRIQTAFEEFPTALPPAQFSKRVPEELEELQSFITYSLSADSDPQEVLQFAKRAIKYPLSGLNGLAEIALEGIPEQALYIDLHRDRLDALGIDENRLLQHIRSAITMTSAGAHDQNGERGSLIITPGDSVLAYLKSLPVAIPNATMHLPLSQLADFTMGVYPVKQVRRINGKRSLNIRFIKESGADALTLAESIHAAMAQVETPQNWILLKESDSTEDLRNQLDELAGQAIYALVCVLIVLILFIRTLAAPLLILSSIALSVTLAIIGLHVLDFSLNILTQAALTVSFGMLVDNAVVIYEHLNAGLPKDRTERIRHIRDSIGGIIVPVLGSTLTTLAIFVPLMFALPEIRLFLDPIAITITLSLLASLLVGFIWIPYVMIWLIPHSAVAHPAKENTPFSWLETPMTWIRKGRWILYVGVMLAIGIPLHLIPKADEAGYVLEINQENAEEPPMWKAGLMVAHYFYDSMRGDFEPWIGGLWYRFSREVSFSEPWGRRETETVNVRISTPQGTPMEELDKIASNFEFIAQTYLPYMDYMETFLSEYSGAMLTYHIKPEFQFTVYPYLVKGEAMYLAARTGNSDISVWGYGDGFSNYGGGGGGSLSFELTGSSYDQLLDVANYFKGILERNRRVREVNINQSNWWNNSDNKQFVLVPDDEALLQHNMDRTRLYQRITSDVNDFNTVGFLEMDAEKVFLIVRNSARSNRIEDFLNRPLMVDSTMIRMHNVASLQRQETQSTITRENQTYRRTVAFTFLGPSKFGSDFLNGVLESTPVPMGVTAKRRDFTWFFDQQNKANIALILSLCVLCVMLTVAATLEHIRGAFWVLFSIPLGAIGVMTGVLYHEINFGRGAIAGTLLLTGIIVNNAILLVHSYLQQEKSGISGLTAWQNVLRQRIRPIVVTTVTTMAGLLPILLLGTDDFWIGLATVVLWGLGIGTALLVVFVISLGKSPIVEEEVVG